MSSLRPAVLASLALVTLATAYCGGKISGVQTTGPDASIPPGNGCPSSEEIYSLGTPCAWSGVCSLQVDVCENGQGVPLATVCSAGTLEVAAGQAYSCSVRVGPSTCPDPSSLGACSDGIVCPRARVGCGTEDCTCVGGAWACPGCSPGTGVGSDGGDDDGGGIGDAGEGDDSGSAPDATVRPGCYPLPGQPQPHMVAGVYCPFSGNGGPNLTCGKADQCCVTPEGTGTPSTCEPAGACPVANSVKIECEARGDCIENGAVCCSYGTIAIQSAQPGCGPGGSTLPASAYVSGFNYGPSGVKGTGGTFCATTCAVSNDAGPVPTFQVCSQNAECQPGQVCTGVEPSGVVLGYCATAVDAGTGG
jgi:hypothetical protein